MSELKPCPFCGEKPILRRSEEEFDNGELRYVYFVRCDNTCCEINPCTDCDGEPCSDCVICGNDLAWDASMPRKEAILKMAKKRFEAEYGKKWEETTDEFRGAFLKTAETMLDALIDE